MGIGTDVDVNRQAGLAEDIEQGVINGLLNAADAGFEESQDRVAVDTGDLRFSGVAPEWTGEAVVWGYTAPHADDVERGTPPHHVPVEDLRTWARRVLGNEDLAGPVSDKIAEEGTDPQPFVEPGVTRMQRRLDQTGLKAWIQRERGRGR